MSGNFKTTVAGVIAAVAQVIGTQYPELAALSSAISALASAALGYFAADAKSPAQPSE